MDMREIDDILNKPRPVSRTVFVEGTAIKLAMPNDMLYEVPLDECQDADGILKWVYHLSGKTWLTREMLNEFTAVAASHAGFSLHF